MADTATRRSSRLAGNPPDETAPIESVVVTDVTDDHVEDDAEVSEGDSDDDERNDDDEVDLEATRTSRMINPRHNVHGTGTSSDYMKSLQAALVETQLPNLSELKVGAWKKFKEDLRKYKARGGISKAILLCDEAIMKKIRLRAKVRKIRVLKDRADQILDGTIEDRYLLKGVDQLFGPRDEYQAMTLLEKTAMKGEKKKNFPLSQYEDYIERFGEALDRMPEAVKPSEKDIKKQFVLGILPRRIQHFMKKSKRKDEVWEQTAERLCEKIEMLEELMPMEKEEPNQKGSSKFKGTCNYCKKKGHKEFECRTKKKDEAKSNKKDTEKKEIKCFGCGEEGHRRPECPNKEKAGYRSSGNSTARLMRMADDAGEGSIVEKLQVKAVFSSPGYDNECILPVYRDSCAEFSHMNEKHLDLLQEQGVIATVKKSTQSIKGYNGKTEVCRGKANFQVKMPDGYEGPMTFLIVDVEDIIIGVRSMIDLGMTNLPLIGSSMINHLQETYEDMIHETELEHNVRKMPMDKEEVTDEERLKVDNLLKDFEELFKEGLPGAKVEPMKIRVTDESKLLKVKAFPLSPRLEEITKEKVYKMEANKVIGPSLSEYASPGFLVKKYPISRGYRFVTDFSQLNEVSVIDRYPAPNTEHILMQLGGSKYYAVLDLRECFHQIILSQESRKYTSFVTIFGQYEYLRAPMGFKGTSAHVQRVIKQLVDKAIGGRHGVFVYMDDILIAAKSFEEFLEILRLVLGALLEANFRLSKDKCIFVATRVKYLGHLVSREGISILEERKQGLQDLMVPTNKKELRSVIGFMNYFRKFLPRYAVLAKPLTSMTGSRATFKWNDTANRAFVTLKNMLVAAPILAFIDYDLDIVLYTDASDRGVGAGLFNIATDGEEKAIAYISHAFNATEQRWSTYEQECFALVWAVTKFDMYLRGHHFTIKTDHRNLLWLSKSKAAKVQRWRMRLNEYDFTISHVAGKDNIVADGLSRCCIIRINKEDVIAKYHNALVGHFGVNATCRLILESGVNKWEDMVKDVSAYIKSCAICQKCRLKPSILRKRRSTTMQTSPFQVVRIDTIGPLPLSINGNRYIITTVDSFTRFVELTAVPSTSAIDAARAILSWVGRYGSPLTIRTDNGSQYAAELISAIKDFMKIGSEFSVPYDPRSMGIVERHNGEVGRHLRALCHEIGSSNHWDDYLPLVQRMMNGMPSRTTGFAPSELLFGGAIRLNAALVDTAFTVNSEAFDDTSHAAYLEDLVQRQFHLMQIAAKEQEKLLQAISLKEGVDKKVIKDASDAHFVPNDLVLMTPRIDPLHKLSSKLKGPYRVIERIGSGTYRLMNLVNELTFLAAFDWLTKFDDSRISKEDLLKLASRDNEEFIVEAILEHRLIASRMNVKNAGTRKGDFEFKIRWKGYGEDENSWEPYANVKDLVDFRTYVARFENLRKLYIGKTEVRFSNSISEMDGGEVNVRRSSRRHVPSTRLVEGKESEELLRYME